MADEETKEALAITIRELGRQNEDLQRRINTLLRRPKDARTISACLGFELRQAGVTSLYQAVPQVVFKPERLCIAKECALHFIIRDVRVGMRSQLIAPAPLPASLFAVENVHRLREVDLEEDFDAAIPMTYDMCQIGMFITIDVVRKSREQSDVPFECVMVGEVLSIEREDLPKGPLTLTKKPSSN